MKDFNILILDDEEGIRDELVNFFNLYEYKVFSAGLPSEAFAILSKNNIDIMIIDIQLPEMNGIEVLTKLKKNYPDVEAIMITGHGDHDCIIQSLRLGASDFFKKPFRTIELKTAIERTQKFINLTSKLKKLEYNYSIINNELQRQIFSKIIGVSKKMRDVMALVEKVAAFDDTSVLITGESGTGKELIARSIHILSNRKNTFFHAVNCSSTPENLFESEFFGHKKGAFTGANSDKVGWFEIANHGTLFLDEIGDLPLSQQSKFLRVLEEKKVHKVGSHKEIPIDVRIISATNQNLEKMVESKEFRLDLLHRLNTFTIEIPPLRERKEDIVPLFNYFVNQFSSKMRKDIKEIEKNVYENLLKYDFAGNVRELKNLSERAVILSENGIIKNKDIPLSSVKASHIISTNDNDEELGLELNEIRLIKKALQKTNYNKSQAAQLLKISWYALDRKIKKYKI